MFIELNPGTANAPVAKQGYTIPVSNTNPDINPDEILASLDADTRAYLDLLVNGAGQGLRANGGSELAKVLARFLPTHRVLAQLNSGRRGPPAEPPAAVHSLQVLNTALSHNQGQIVQLIDSSSKVFHAFANANQGVSQAIHLTARDAPAGDDRRSRRSRRSRTSSRRRRATCSRRCRRSQPPTRRRSTSRSRSRRC